MREARPKAVICGWFSYADGHATAGDLLARDVLCDWLDELGIETVTAVAPPFTGGPGLDSIDPAEFTHAFFVCGPFERGPLEADFLSRFAHCRLIGLNLSLQFDPQEWQPFDLLIERDSAADTNADMVFASRSRMPPLIGLCLVEPYPQGDAETANAALERLLARHQGARIAIDTRLDVNSTGLRTKGEIEAVIARVDVLVTTRLHGLVLALKNGVPAIAVDPAPGGGKIKRQCARIGWPNVFVVDEIDDPALDKALAFALSDEAKAVAAECAQRAGDGVESVRIRLIGELSGEGELERNFEKRQSQPAGNARPNGWRSGLRNALRKLRP